MATLAEAPMHEKESAIMEILDNEDTTESTEEDVVETDGEPEEGLEEADAEEAEESEDDEPEQEADEEPEFTVKVRGEERKVKLQELQDGYSRTEDYKAKTAEIAEMRRAAEAEKARYVEQLNVVLQTAQEIDPILSEGARTDWAALAKEDPFEYTEKKAVYDQRVAQINQMAQERDRLIKEQTAEHTKREEEALIAARPEWADPEVGAKAMNAVRESLVKHYDFKPEEVLNISNHKFALVAEDARKYHELIAQQEQVKAKKAPLKPTKSVKPSRKDTPSKADAAMRQKAKNGSLDDKTEFILSIL